MTEAPLAPPPRAEEAPGRFAELRLGRTRLAAHPLALLFPLALGKLGAPGDARALLIALCAHEGAHLVAARLLGIRVNALRLMPIGGALDLGNPYALGAGRLFAAAAAGPLGNLLAILALSTLSQLGALPASALLPHLRVNLSLMLFNLLPALPLDGGRMLFALLSPRLGPSRAAGIGLGAGRALAAALVALALLGWRATRRLNLTPVLAAVFLLAAGPGELRALTDTRVQALLNALRPLCKPVPARLFAVGADCDVRTALRAATPDAVALYAVFDGGRFLGLADERSLLTALAEGGDARAGGAVLPMARRPGPKPPRAAAVRAHFG